MRERARCASGTRCKAAAPTEPAGETEPGRSRAGLGNKTRDPYIVQVSCFIIDVRERIRTPDTLVRSQVLYPAELHTHIN